MLWVKSTLRYEFQFNLFSLKLKTSIFNKNWIGKKEEVIWNKTKSKTKIRINFYDNYKLPDFGSVRIFEEIIVPNGVNKFSNSCWVISNRRPQIYRLAPFIVSELGLA